MAELDQLYDALRKADAAGNTEDAKKLADYLRSHSAAPAAPVTQGRPEDVGFFEAIPAALGRGVESFKEMGTGLGLAGKQITGDTEAARQIMAQAKEQKPEAKPGMTVADFERIAAEKGILAAAKEAPKYIVEQVLQSAPQMAGPLAAGAAASPFLTPVGGALVGMGVYGVQQFGNFLMRQAQEKDDPAELEMTKAALTAAGTAPLGYFADRFTVGLGGVGKNAGKEVLTELAKRRAAGEIGAGAVGKEVAKRAGVGAVEGIIAEAPTEVLEQAAERYQAGLSLTDDKALAEYKDAFFGAAAAGGGIGGGAKGVQTYGEYRGELRGVEPTQPPESRRSAFSEATEYEDTGTISRGGEPSVSVPGEQGGTEPGTEGTTAGGVGGAELSPSGTAVREEALDNQLRELKNEQDKIAAFDPNDPRIGDLEEIIKEVQAERKGLNAPSQGSFEFGPEEPGKEPERFVRSSEAAEFSLSAPEGKVAETKGIEAAPEQEKAKMMLVGDRTNPMKPLSSFFNSLKPSTANPAEAVKYRSVVNNFLDDVAEFIGARGTKEVSRFKEKGAPSPVPEKGPDVNAPLTGPELDSRMAFLNNFFDSLSIASKDKEALTSALSQRFAGMDAKQQSEALSNLTNVPQLNTRRGIEDLQTKFREALTKFERARIGEEETALPYKLTDELTDFDPYTLKAISRSLKILQNMDPKDRTPEDQAAYNYFNEKTGWRYVLAMRSAAFDLGVPKSDFTGVIFKDQNKEQAELFKKWVEENLPASEYRKFEATEAAYKRQVARADESIKVADRLKKIGGVGKTYSISIGRSPSGKAAGVQGAGMRQFMRPSPVEKLDPSKFYPMHPVVQEKLMNNDLNGALNILAKDPGKNASRYMKFVAGYAQRLRDMGLKTTVVINKQNQLAADYITKAGGPARRQVMQWIQSYEWGNQWLDEHGFNAPLGDPKAIERIVNTLQYIDIGTDFGIPNQEEVFKPIKGQLEQLTNVYETAYGNLTAGGSYFGTMDLINLNPNEGGLSTGFFLHEVTHAATMYATAPWNFKDLSKPQQEAVTELKEVFEYVKDLYDKDVVKFTDDYGMINLREFIAEAMSNEKFQEELRRIKYKGENISLWDKFTNFIKRLFGLDNVAGYSMANINIIMQAAPAKSKEEAALNSRGRSARSVLNNTMPTNPGYMGFFEKDIFKGRPSWDALKTNMSQLIENVNDTARQYYLGGFTLRQLNDMIGHKIPQFRTFIDKVEGMLDDRNRMLEDTKKIVDKWMRFQKENPDKSRKLNGVMLDATLQAKDPAKGPTGIQSLDNAWDAIGPEGQAIYIQVRDYYSKSLQNYIDNIVENKKSQLRTVLDPRDPKYAQETAALEKDPDIQKLRKHFSQHSIEPYFPLRRFGRFSVQFLEGKRKEFYTFESAGERNAFISKRKEQLERELGRPLSDNEVKPRNSIQKLVSENMRDFTFLKDLKDIVQTTSGKDVKELRENLEESLEQLYLLTLPDQSIRKMFMNRKGTAGMDTDMLRAFTSSAFHMSYQHSRFKHSRGLYNDIQTAKESVREKGEEGKVEGEYVNELDQRLKYIMNPTDTGAIPSFLSNVSFIWFMTAPASALVNMLGVPAVGMPVVAAKFGWKNTAAKMGEYAAKFAGTGFKDQDGNMAFPSLNNKPGLFSPVQQRAYEQFVADGLIDITLSHDLVGMAEAPSNIYTGKSQTVMKWLSGAFHGAEKFNREIVAMSTFDMAYEKAKADGYSDDAAFRKATQIAKDLTYKSMFDYSTLNKPRYFQHPVAKVVLQFKQFSQQMTYLLARSAYEAIHKDYSADELQDIRYKISHDHMVNKPDLPPLTDAELDAKVHQYIKDTRIEGRNRLAGTLGMTAVFAGATGLPLWWMVSGVMNALHAAFGDDDEEWDFDNWFKNWCNRTFGGFVGDSISRGVVSQTLGANVADRLSLNDMWYRDARKSADEVSAVQNTLINLLGPTAGLMINAAEGVKQYNDGHVERAMETFSPALIKNILKSGRFLEEGRATTIRGNELVGDITGAEVGAQFLGFTPERVAQRQKANIEMKSAEQNILNKRQALLDAFFMSVDNSDDALRERVLDKIVSFNKAHPGVAITAKNASASVKTRFKMRALAETTGGMAINKKLIGELQDMADWGNPD